MISKIIQSIKLYLHRKEKFYGLSISEWGFVPGNKGLYTLALLHKSASRYTKSGTVLNYERLEFLGDAVLGAIVAEILYKFFPNKDEGFMTRLRSKIVSRESLNIIAIKMGLSEEVIAKSDTPAPNNAAPWSRIASPNALFTRVGTSNVAAMIASSCWNAKTRFARNLGLSLTS